MQFRLHLIVSRQFIDIFFNIHRKDCFSALDEGFQETFHTQTKNCFNRNISTYYPNVCRFNSRSSHDHTSRDHFDASYICGSPGPHLCSVLT